MILISHRGNIEGRNISKENTIDYIENALNLNYNVEIDIWYIDETLFLGHDFPHIRIDIYFLNTKNLWIHCKNIETLEYLKDVKFEGIYFWHQEDDVTLTSNNYLWTYPGKNLTKYSIAVLPELSNYDKQTLKKCYGICSDYIINYKNIQ